MKNPTDNQRGMAAILTIIIVGMATLTMVTTSSLLGMDQLEMSYSRDKGREAFYLAESCANEALRRIKIDPESLLSDISLPADNGFCIINMPDNGTILTTGLSGGYNKRIRVSIAISGRNITVNDWREE